MFGFEKKNFSGKLIGVYLFISDNIYIYIYIYIQFHVYQYDFDWRLI